MTRPPVVSHAVTVRAALPPAPAHVPVVVMSRVRAEIVRIAAALPVMLSAKIP